MATDSAGAIRIGRHTIPMDQATAWVTAYTDASADQSTTKPYAYPAYDCYEASNNNPTELRDADLLAPMLLNVKVSIEAFYGLRRVRGRLEASLHADDLARPLATLDDE